MKAGDLFIIQHCAEHGSFRVLPLRSCADLARLDMTRDRVHLWVVVGYAVDEGDAYAKMKAMKREMKENFTKEDGG